jgi:hypothetical protein
VECDEIRRGKGHVRDRIFRMHLAIEHGGSLQLQHVRDFVRHHEHRPEAEECVEAFAAREVARILAQDVLGGQFEDGRESGDHAEPVGFRHVAPFAPEDHAEFRFAGGFPRFLRDTDLVARTDDRGAGFHEARGLLVRGFLGEIGGVRGVVEPDAPDLARPPVERAKAHARAGQKISGSGGRRFFRAAAKTPRLQVEKRAAREEGEIVGRPVALESPV